MKFTRFIAFSILVLIALPSARAQTNNVEQTLRNAAALCKVGEVAETTLHFPGVGLVIVNATVVETDPAPRTVSICREADREFFLENYLIPTTDFLGTVGMTSEQYEAYLQDKLRAIRNLMNDQGLLARERTVEEQQSLRESRQSGNYRADLEIQVMVNTIYEQGSIGRGPSLVQIHLYLPFDEAPRGTLTLRDRPYNDRYRNLAATLLTLSESADWIRGAARLRR